MRNRKKVLLFSLTSVLSIALLLVSIFAGLNKATSFKAYEPYSCEYYFDDDNGYTSIYEANKQRYITGSDVSDVKTWGTVVTSYLNSSGSNIQVIQSTDEDGNVGATTLYNVSQSQLYSAGSVVTVTGKVSLYSGMPQMKNISITRNITNNPYPPEAYEITSVPTSSSSNFNDFLYSGSRLVKISSVTLGPVGTNKTHATLLNGDVIDLFYGGVPDATTSAIRLALEAIADNDKLADITGYLAYYNNSFQIQVKNENDVSEASTTTELVVGTYKSEYSVGEEFVKPNVYFVHPGGIDNVTDQAVFTGFNSSTPGTYRITVTYNGYSTYFDITVINPSVLYHEVIEFTVNNKYNNGNYGTDSGFGYYRAVPSSDNLVKLLPLEATHSVDTIGGSFYNLNPIDDIRYINITYSTSDSSGYNSPKLYYGENNYDDGYISLSYSRSSKYLEIDLSSYDVNYFKFDSGDTELTINSATVYYSNNSTTHGDSFIYKGANDGQYRSSPTAYTGTLRDGQSSIYLPIAYDEATHTVTQTKKYTYYSFDYIESHPQYKSDATMLSATDVANYYLAFGCAPANYGKSGTVSPMRDGLDLPTKSDVNSLFGSNARLVQQFSRTTGYAQSVPYYGSIPTYYEFDIDVNGEYSTSSRETGRIVAWSTGFNASGYGSGSQPVCLFTDDHYATFAEYNNMGYFMPRFNVEQTVMGAVWSNPTTL